MRWLTPLALGLAACGTPSPPVDSGTALTETWCGDAPGCVDNCAAGPTEVTHATWWNRLSESPPLAWSPVDGATSYQISVGRSPGATDVACWTDVGNGTEGQHGALWGVLDGEQLFANVRAVLPDGTTEATSSSGWTLDIQPPDVPSALDDSATPVSGALIWSHAVTDDASGFSHFEVRVGTAPGADDELPWTPIGAATQTTLDLAWTPESWHWAQVRAVDVAGNPSQPVTSSGFISCPEGYVYIPEDDALGNGAFCVAKYEMKIQGVVDGDQVFSGTFVAESRPDGTPWVNMDKEVSRSACDSLGFGYQLLTTRQWQSIARSIERTDANWSGGAVGLGEVNRGHSDRLPMAALESDGTDPCFGLDNPLCADPTSEDFRQKRTHALHNGEGIWDLAGNVWEQVDGSLGGPDTLWVSFDHSAFTTDDGWEDQRLQFAPEGPYTEAQGMGRMYGGTGNLVRGGCYDHPSPGVGGASGIDDMGIYASHHNTWNTGNLHGFRCAFMPM